MTPRAGSPFPSSRQSSVRRRTLVSWAPRVVVWLFIGTQKKVSGPPLCPSRLTKRRTYRLRSVIYRYVSRQSSEKWFKPEYLSYPLSSPREQLNKWYFIRKGKTPRVRELSRDIWARTLTGGERIGARISMYEERERERDNKICMWYK